eukprot:TRINITY_DN1196_c1_g2_i1.p1 TRINITY_DN1196_c1_g2~~TRINITY_DN1196_c1_g2_i1.p1  ORF type:complete len:299 (+),score=37.26 TRINITY_DN1196_c1_g2_i1:106-1002(+)
MNVSKILQAIAKTRVAYGKKLPVPDGVLLAKKWDGKTPVAGYWMSEKLDGVRAYWTGSTFISRNGNEFTAPYWFTKCLPRNKHLDGELFCGRGNFQSTVSVVKSSSKHPGWKHTKYHIFDIPSVKKEWEVRKDLVEKLECISQNHITFCRHKKCRDNKHVHEEMDRILSRNGEGVMLRQPGSMYVHARSPTLLKVKRFLDCEALVTGIEPGKGRNFGRMGALHCELENGKQFYVGTGFTDAQRAKPPRIGSVITIRYQMLTTSGIPRFPAFVTVRPDATWKGRGGKWRKGKKDKKKKS